MTLQLQLQLQLFISVEMGVWTARVINGKNTSVTPSQIYKWSDINLEKKL